MSDDYSAEMEAAANAILPPLGSVFENTGAADGPPMMRMILM